MRSVAGRSGKGIACHNGVRRGYVGVGVDLVGSGVEGFGVGIGAGVGVGLGRDAWWWCGLLLHG